MASASRAAARSAAPRARICRIGAGAAPPVYYFLAPEAAGQGLATEIVGAFAAEMVARHAPAGLTAEVFADNPASCRVLEKCGFARVEAHRFSSVARPAPAPGWLFRRSGAVVP